MAGFGARTLSPPEAGGTPAPPPLHHRAVATPATATDGPVTPPATGAEPQPAAMTITGVVLDAAGHPVGGAVVQFCYEDEQAGWYDATTAADGRFALAPEWIEAGTITAWHAHQLEPVSFSVTPRPGETRVTLRFTVGPAGAMSVRVRWPVEVRTAEAWAHLLDGRGRLVREDRLIGDGLTLLANLAPDEYRLRALALGSPWLLPDTLVRVGANETTDVDLRVLSSPGLTGTVVDATGLPLGRAVVYADQAPADRGDVPAAEGHDHAGWDYHATLLQHAHWLCPHCGRARVYTRAGADGRFEIAGLRPGPAELTVHHQGGNAWRGAVAVGGPPVRIALDSPPPLEVEIASGDAGPWTVAARGPGASFAYEFARGRVVPLRGLAPGPHVVLVGGLNSAAPAMGVAQVDLAAGRTVRVVIALQPVASVPIRCVSDLTGEPVTDFDVRLRVAGLSALFGPYGQDAAYRFGADGYPFIALAEGDSVPGVAVPSGVDLTLRIEAVGFRALDVPLRLEPGAVGSVAPLRLQPE